MFEYKIVVRGFPSLLDAKVRELAESGWRPQGGASVFVAGAGCEYAQAMVREPVASRKGPRFEIEILANPTDYKLGEEYYVELGPCYSVDQARAVAKRAMVEEPGLIHAEIHGMDGHKERVYVKESDV